MKTIILAGFPGIGKSFLKKEYGDGVSDSDSSQFPKDEFPQNYIKHIKKLMGVKNIILTSTHKVVLNSFENENMPYILVHPSYDQKNDYIQRYIDRGSPEQFIEILTNSWDDFFNDLHTAKPMARIVLNKGEYLKDKIESYNE